MDEDRWGKMLAALRYVSPKDWGYVVPFVEDVLSEKIEAERARADRLAAALRSLTDATWVEPTYLPAWVRYWRGYAGDNAACVFCGHEGAGMNPFDIDSPDDWPHEAGCPMPQARAALADSPKEETNAHS